MCWTSEPKNRHTHTHIHKICIYYQHAFKTQFKGWICWNKHVINRAIILKSEQPKQSSRWSRRNTRSFLITCEHKDPIPAQRNILKRSKTFVFASFFIVLSRTIFTYRKKNTQQKLGHHIIFDATNLIGIWIKMQKSWFENRVKVFRSQKFQFNSCHDEENEKKVPKNITLYAFWTAVQSQAICNKIASHKSWIQLRFSLCVYREKFDDEI